MLVQEARGKRQCYDDGPSRTIAGSNRHAIQCETSGKKPKNLGKEHD